MNQSNWIAAFLFIGFFVYITIKGQLPQFQKAIFGGSQSGAGTGASSSESETDPLTGLSNGPPV